MHSEALQAVKLYRDRRLENYKPPERLLVPEWGETNIILTEKETDYPGGYRTAVAPYCIGPMEAFTDRTVRTIVFCTCAQAGKTINVIIIPMAYTIDQDPGPVLLVLPTEPLARSFSETRLQNVFNNSPAVSVLKPTNEDKYKLLEMHFRRSDVFLVGSNSPANLASRPIRYLFADEVDKFPAASAREADALALAMERIKAKFKSKAVLTSTPSTPEGNIWRYWNRSDMRHLLIACPHCKHKQKPIMGAREEYDLFEGVVMPPKGSKHTDLYRLKWPKDCRISELDGKAWLECEKCRGKINDLAMNEAIKNATWKSSGDSLGIAGFHLNAFGLPWVRLGQIAAEFLRSKRNPDELQNFYNSWLAIPWDAVAQGTDTINIEKIVGCSDKKGYLINTCPPGVMFCTAGIDVQAHEVYYVIRGWGEDEYSALVSFGRIPVETDDINAFVAAVSGIMRRDYGAPLILGGIDSGWGARTAEVYTIARSVPRLVCTKGRRSNITRQSDGKDIPLPRPTRIDKMPDGKPVTRGPLLYSPSTSFFKRWFFSRVNAEPSSWVWPDGLDVSKDGKTYLRHLESEKEVEKKNPQTGRVEKNWIVRRGYEDNHWLDAEIIACVVLEITLTAAKAKKLTAADIKQLVAKMKGVGSSQDEQEQRRPQRPRRKSQNHGL